MLLPTKGISADRALICVGSDILQELQGPASVSALWERYRRSSSQPHERVTFDWFSLALAALFAMNLVELASDGYLRRIDVH